MKEYERVSVEEVERGLGAVVDVDIRAQHGDVTFRCPSDHWRVTLKPEGAAAWTKNGTITPTCRKCGVALERTVKA